ncbi:MAG: TIM barrel protein [Gemmataceae bacterium]
MSRHLPDRRSLLRAGAGATLVGSTSLLAAADAVSRKGGIRQSVCRWCYGSIPLEKLCQRAREIGFQSIELLGPEEVKVVQKFGLTCAMLAGGGNIADGFNRTENHDRLIAGLKRAIEFAAAHKLPNVICMSGNRRGMDDADGLKNCAVGLKRVVGFAEKHGVTLCMEGLNSRVDHKDYMYDRTAWGVDLCKQVGSPRFKLLYDIYHMQIMEGDVIRTLRANKEYIGHYHTGGNPGRHEIDATQDLNYPAIMRAIIETGYTGFVGQEFLPTRDPLTSLAEAFRICDV